MKKQRFELAHDIIAEKIWARLPEQDKLLRQITRSITQRQEDYEAGRGSLLGKAELDAWKLYLPYLSLSTAQQDYLEKSKRHLAAIEKKEQERLEKEKRQIARNRQLQRIVAFVLLAASIVSGYFFLDASIARKEGKEIVSKAEARASEIEEELSITEEELVTTKADLLLNRSEAEQAKRVLEEALYLKQIAEEKARLADSTLLIAEQRTQQSIKRMKKAQEGEAIAVSNYEYAVKESNRLLEIATEERQKAAAALASAIQSERKVARAQKKERARSLAFSSNQLNPDKKELKALLALEAVRLYDSIGGDPAIYPDVFEAIYSGHNSLNESAKNRSNYLLLNNKNTITDIEIPQTLNAFYLISTTGEVEKWPFRPFDNPVDKPNILNKELIPNIPTNLYNKISFSPDESLLAIGGRSKNIYIENLKEGKRTSIPIQLSGFEELYTMQFIDKEHLIFSGSNKTLSILNVHTKSCIPMSPLSTETIEALAVIDSFLFVGDHKGNLYRGRISRGNFKAISRLKKATSRVVTAMATFKDQVKEKQLLAVGYNNGFIEVYTLKDTEALSIETKLDFDHHTARITDLKFSTDGRQLAAASMDQTASVIYPRDTVNIFPLILRDFERGLTAIDFLNDDQHLIIGTKSGMIKFLSLNMEDYTQDLCKLIGTIENLDKWESKLKAYYDISKITTTCDR